MQLVEICSDSVIVHCPVCGKASLSPKGEVKGCRHLVFVSANETWSEPWFVREGIKDTVADMLAHSSDEDDFDSYLEVLGEYFPAPEFLLFEVQEPVPNGFTMYLLYQVA